MIPAGPDATATAASIRNGSQSAHGIVADTLGRIDERNGALNCFLTPFADSAPDDAAAIDRAIAAGTEPGLLAGVPFGVKDLFDVGGRTTRAGSIILADDPPAAEDATAVGALKAAGAVAIGSTNMDELAFGFTTENAHYGAAHNPHDESRSCGGSSGGSAAAVAAGLVPLALGSDTNGSIRVPAALCGVYGMKPTYGRISRAGVAPLAWSFDHVGWFSRSLRDTATVFDVLQAPDPRDPVATDAPPIAAREALKSGIGGLRCAVAGGHFATGGLPEVFAAVAEAATALGGGQSVDIPESPRAVAASLLITSCEAASLRLDAIRARPEDFDPHTRDRWIAAAMLPAAWYHEAQRFRRRFHEMVLEVFKEIDVLITPTTPFPAPKLGQGKIEIEGRDVQVRPSLARFVAPFSFIGLPVLSVPIHRDGLPLGVQLVAAPNNETAILRAAAALVEAGIAEDQAT